jgi:anti-sigma regulatory factor (Ser/Thr protein kinase)
VPETAYTKSDIAELYKSPEGVPYEFEKFEFDEKKGSMKIVILSDRQKTESVAHAIGEAVEKLGWARGEIDNMKIAITEAVNNAIYHGNLATSRQRGREEKYTADLDEAARSYKGLKPVTIECAMTKESTTVTVKDLGKKRMVSRKKYFPQ